MMPQQQLQQQQRHLYRDSYCAGIDTKLRHKHTSQEGFSRGCPPLGRFRDPFCCLLLLLYICIACLIIIVRKLRGWGAFEWSLSSLNASNARQQRNIVVTRLTLDIDAMRRPADIYICIEAQQADKHHGE